MAEPDLPQQILIAVEPASPATPEDGSSGRRIFGRRPGRVESIDLSQLQSQVNIFLQQVDVIMANTPETVGGFGLAEFEVSAGIKLEAKGGIQLVLLANAEATAGLTASMKFVFRRK